jgi:hypothetical protein
MADLSITAANVVKGSDANFETGTSGDTLTAGMSVYKDTADSNKWKKASAASTAALAGSGGIGIALHAASSGQPIVVQTGGTITIGATIAVGQVYVVSPTAAGGIAPFTDLNTNNYVTYLGYGSTTAILKMLSIATGLQAGTDLA